MKKIFIINTLLLGLVALAGFQRCQSLHHLDSAQVGRVIEIKYIHDLSPGTELVSKDDSELISVVRVLIAEDPYGNQVVVLGEPSDSNSTIFYMGIVQDQLVFRMTSGNKSLQSDSAPEEVLQFAADSRYLDLWGIPFEVMDMEVSSDTIILKVLDTLPSQI